MSVDGHLLSLCYVCAVADKKGLLRAVTRACLFGGKPRKPAREGKPQKGKNATPLASRKKRGATATTDVPTAGRATQGACRMAGPAAHRAQEPDKGNAPTRREQPATARQRQPSPTTMMTRHHRRKSIETPWRVRRGERQARAAHPQAGEGGPHPQPRTAHPMGRDLREPKASALRVVGRGSRERQRRAHVGGHVVITKEQGRVRRARAEGECGGRARRPADEARDHDEQPKGVKAINQRKGLRGRRGAPRAQRTRDNEPRTRKPHHERRRKQNPRAGPRARARPQHPNKSDKK